MPATENKLSLFRLISKKSIVPDEKEVKKNIRSRSAKLRYGIRSNSTFFYPEEFKSKFINYMKLESRIL